jgi:hypothetical protein
VTAAVAHSVGSAIHGPEVLSSRVKTEGMTVSDALSVVSTSAVRPNGVTFRQSPLLYDCDRKCEKKK